MQKTSPKNGPPPRRSASVKHDETVAGRVITFSNPDKVLFPRDSITKGQLVAYYRRVAPYLLPQLHDRPLTMQRFPDGIDGMSFFEKDAPKYVPDWVQRYETAAPGAASGRGKVAYIICNDEATLAWVANLASVVLHVWTSKLPDLESPDFLFFDLDPGDRCSIGKLARVALAVRSELQEIGLEPIVKTSGGAGLHVIVPLAQRYSYEDLKLFAEAVARRLAQTKTADVTLERSVAKRPEDRVYFDWVQVGRGKTIVPAYAVRARDGAPVSTPLQWDEVEAYARKRSGSPPDVFAAFTMQTIFKRLDKTGDLWSKRAWKAQKLEPAIKKARSAWHET